MRIFPRPPVSFSGRGDHRILATVHNVGNIPSAFNMDVTQESDVFSELSAKGEPTEMAPGESRTLDFTLGVDGSDPGN